MDSIERRKLKNKPKTATLQLITSAHVWKKVYTLSLFLLTSFFSPLHLHFLQSSLVFQRGGALRRTGGKRKPRRDCQLLQIRSHDQFELTLKRAVTPERLETLKTGKARQQIYFLIYSQNYYALKQDPLLHYRVEWNKHLHLCTIPCNLSFLPASEKNPSWVERVETGKLNFNFLGQLHF